MKNNIKSMKFLFIFCIFFFVQQFGQFTNEEKGDTS